VIGFLADLHVANHRRFGGEVRAGINRRCQVILNTIARATMRAGELGVTDLVVLGDVFDTTRPEPQVISALQELLGNNQFRTHILVGNHDQESAEVGDHALGPLDGFGLIKVYDRPTTIKIDGIGVMMVPFQPGPAKDWLAGAMSKAYATSNIPDDTILALHLGLMGGDTPAYMRDVHDAIHVDRLSKHCEEFGIKAVAAGNWHGRWETEVSGIKMIQVGSLCPTGFDNPGSTGYGSLTLWDSATGFHTDEIPGPRFLKARGLSETRKMLQQGVNLDSCSVYYQIHVDRNEAQAAQELVAAWDLSERVDLTYDKREAEAAARSAAHAARSASTLESALAHFVTMMDLEEGVAREEVLNRCRAYLKL